MSTRQQRVIDTPLDFADWADGPRVRSVNEVDGEMRARVEAAFVAAEAQAAERLQEVDETVRRPLADGPPARGRASRECCGSRKRSPVSGM